MPKAKRMMPDKVAYAIWKFLIDYPRRGRSGEMFQNDFATLLEEVKNYSIIARFEDKIETASGIYYRPDLLVNIRNLKDTFIVFECKWGQKVDYTTVTAFCQKADDLSFKKELIIYRNSGSQPLVYRLRKLYRGLISLHKPSPDALGFCWGYGLPVFFRGTLPEEIVPLRVVRYRLSLFQPSDANEENAKSSYLSELSVLDEKMFKAARDKPEDHREFLGDVRAAIYGVNMLINGRWIIT